MEINFLLDIFLVCYFIYLIKKTVNNIKRRYATSCIVCPEKLFGNKSSSRSSTTFSNFQADSLTFNDIIYNNSSLSGDDMVYPKITLCCINVA